VEEEIGSKETVSASRQRKHEYLFNNGVFLCSRLVHSDYMTVK